MIMGTVVAWKLFNASLLHVIKFIDKFIEFMTTVFSQTTDNVTKAEALSNEHLFFQYVSYRNRCMLTPELI